MRKLQLVILAAAVAAGAIWWAFYRTHHTSSLAVASLLPRETLGVFHVPDFNRSRGQWHRTDLYQLWKEPAVQDFLAKPRTKVRTEGRVGQTVEDIAAIEMKDAFFAVVAIQSSAWLWDGGFRYAGDKAKAEKLVDSWRTQLFAEGADRKEETLDYEGHQIRVQSAGLLKVSMAWAGQWFFFTNDLENLKALLDRTDGRIKDANTVLSSDEAFLAASKHMPDSYTALLYGRVDQLIEKLTPAGEQSTATPDQFGFIRKVRSFCGAMAFDGGRMRDTIFVGMPKVAELGNLTRASLPLATKDTFFYAASLLDLRKDLEPGWQTPALGWIGGLQKVTGALAASGVKLEDWKNAFGPEVGLIATWAPNTQWPSVLATVPVKDAAQANQILGTITASSSGDVQWEHSEKEGIHYFSNNSGPQLFSFTPTIGLSDRMLIAGPDAGSVESAMKRTGGVSELATSRNFQNADRTITTAQQAFVYVDPALVYTRFDQSLRPLLAMSAAFLPAMSDTVDISKLPPADVIAKHLSPIVMSQSYRGDGYVAESVGPVPLYQTILGTIGAGMAASALYRQEMSSGASTQNVAPPPVATSPSPSPSPEDSP